MRKSSKFILVAGALAALAVPSVASAKVERCPATTTTTTNTAKSATFTVNQPKDSTGQYTNVWRHEYEVAIGADGHSFIGTGKIYDNGATDTTWTEDVTGSLNADGTLTMQTTPVGGGATFLVTNAPMNGTVVLVDTNGTWPQNDVTFKIDAPKIISDSVITTIEYKNHGESVSAANGGKEAAQACAGMPVQTTKGSQL